jgi:hypothetical protein
VVFSTKVPHTLQCDVRQHCAESGVRMKDFVIAAVRARVVRVGKQ